MPKVDFAILCNAAVARDKLISILEGPIDTVITGKVPMQFPVTLAIRFLWTLGELNREHVGEILFQDQDGKQILKIDFHTKVEKPNDSISGWDIGSNMVLNFPLSVPIYGVYSFEILVDDKSVKTLPFRAIKPKK